MNILPLVTFYLINSGAQFADRDINSEIAQSLIYVVEKFFMPRSSSFILILSCERKGTMDFYKNVEDVLLGKWTNIKTQIVANKQEFSPTQPGERLYNLLLIDSWKAFLKIDPASKVQNYDVSEYYHIFLQHQDRFLDEIIQKILNYCWRNFIVNVNIQVQKSSGEIVVYTYFPYTESHCGKVIPVEINRYYNGTMANDVLFPQKVVNMFECPLRVAVLNLPPYLTLARSTNGHYVIGGFEGRLLMQLSKLMNFTISVYIPPNQEERGRIYDNYSTGAIGMLQRREVDLSIGCFYFFESRSRILTGSEFYFQAVTVITFLTGSSIYTPVKTLWFPFKQNASIALLVALLVILSLFWGIARLMRHWWPSVKYRNILFNLISCTLGLPITLGPTNNSGRIFILTWMLFTLIVRTEYQALVYHLIRNNLFRKAPSTLNDVVKLNYTFALHTDAFLMLSQTTFFTDTGLGHVIMDKAVSKVDEIFKYLEDRPNQKLATIAPVELIWNHAIVHKKVGLLTILKDPLLLQNSCIYFPKHSFLADRVNFLVQRINAVGLMDGWVKQSIDLTYLMAKRPPLEGSIDQRELTAIYYLFGIMLLGSFLIFCLELLSLRIKGLRFLFEKL